MSWKTEATERHLSYMGSYSVTCYPTQVNAPRLNPSQTGRPVPNLLAPEGWQVELSLVLVLYRDG